MINIYFSISNPWFIDDFKNLYSVAGDLTKNKSWEFEVSKHSYVIFNISFRLTFRQHHAGLKLELGLLGYETTLQLYDVRHWNYKEKRWEKHKEK